MNTIKLLMNVLKYIFLVCMLGVIFIPSTPGSYDSLNIDELNLALKILAFILNVLGTLIAMYLFQFIICTYIIWNDLVKLEKQHSKLKMMLMSIERIVSMVIIFSVLYRAAFVDNILSSMSISWIIKTLWWVAAVSFVLWVLNVLINRSERRKEVKEIEG